MERHVDHLSAQSVVTFEVKPWDDETDMAKLEEAVRSIDQPGLVWGASKLVPIGYVIRKLQITIVVGTYLRIVYMIQACLTCYPMIFRG